MRAEPASLIITRQTQPKMRMMIVVKYFLLYVFLSFFFFSFSLIKPCCVEVSLLADVNRLVSICGHESFLLVERRRMAEDVVLNSEQQYDYYTEILRN